MERKPWMLEGSISAKNTLNPIRAATAMLIVPANLPKKHLSLALGDPTCFSDFAVHHSLVSHVSAELSSGNSNGYINSSGTEEARLALAKYYSNPNFSLTSTDVIIDIGCSGAISTVITSLANSGDNILIPSPGFPLYAAIAGNRGIDSRLYHLQADHDWEADLQNLESLVDYRTKALVVVNPSNPCGSVYTREHLMELLDFAMRHRIPIIADEVYGRMSFDVPFVSLGELTTEVPVFLVGGLAKRWLVPGWRIGWIIIFDKLKLAEDIKAAIMNTKNIMLHPVTFLVKAIPRILESVPEEFFLEVLGKLKRNAEYVFERVERTPGLSMNMPQGAMYCLVNLDFSRLRDIKTSQEFAEKLVQEEGVTVLPSECFLSSGSFRVVLCNPHTVLEESFNRIQAFLLSHSI